MTHTPKPKKEWIPLERLAFDIRLQMRDLVDPLTGEPVLFSEKWVQHLLEQKQNGAEFKPLKAVEEKQGKRVVLWVYEGFHRGETLRRSGANSAEVEVVPGTFRDAERYALSANSDQPLPRSHSDTLKAFNRLMDSPQLLAPVLDAAKGNGGVLRSIAAAVGLSASVVGKYLEQRGLRADRDSGKLVAVPKPGVVDAMPPPEEPDPEPAPPAKAAAPAAERVTVAAGDLELAGARDALLSAQKDLRSIGRAVESLLRSKVGDHLRQAAKGRKLPLAVKTEDRNADINDLATKTVEFWPALADMQAVFADVAAVLHAGG